MRPWLFLVGIVIAACDTVPQWGFDQIDSIPTPPDPALVCGTVVPSSQAGPRASCAFGAGARVAETLGIEATVSQSIPIRHVIVVMKENRSFDHIFGRLHDLGQPDSEAVPAGFQNPDSSGAPVSPFHATSTCIPFDPGHQSSSMAAAVDGGAMDGFVKSAASSTGTDGHFVMSQYDDTDLPFYYWLANTYALSDRHFASMLSGTFGNRNFLMFGTNAGVVDTGISYPNPNTPSIFRLLMSAGFTWRAYSDAGPLSDALGWKPGDPGVRSMRDFLDDLDRGQLPSVSFVDGREYVEDDHPPDDPGQRGDLQVGEAWLAGIYGHLVASPQWQRTAMIWTYDEAGGFADHVPPPRGCLTGGDQGWPDPSFGPRISLVMISPWARRHYVSHVVHDQTAITRFIEAVFDLPALTRRDANSDALFDLLDFSCGRDLTPPAGAPPAGAGGCQ